MQVSISIDKLSGQL